MIRKQLEFFHQCPKTNENFDKISGNFCINSQQFWQHFLKILSIISTGKVTKRHDDWATNFKMNTEIKTPSSGCCTEFSSVEYYSSQMN